MIRKGAYWGVNTSASPRAVEMNEMLTIMEGPAKEKDLPGIPKKCSHSPVCIIVGLDATHPVSRKYERRSTHFAPC